MKSIQLITVALAAAALTACSGSNEANNADANVALETENVDSSLNVTDVNAVDANAAVDLNASSNVADANAVDANSVSNNVQ